MSLEKTWLGEWVAQGRSLSFVRSFVPSVLESFIGSFVHSLIHWFIDWIRSSLFHSFVRYSNLFIHWFAHSLTHSFISGALIDSWVDSFIRSFVHSFLHSFTQRATAPPLQLRGWARVWSVKTLTHSLTQSFVHWIFHVIDFKSFRWHLNSDLLIRWFTSQPQSVIASASLRHSYKPLISDGHCTFFETSTPARPGTTCILFATISPDISPYLSDL